MMPIYRLSGLLLTVMIAGCAVAPPAPAPVNPAVEERPLAAAAEPVHSPSEVQVMAAVDNENNVFFVLGSSGINAVGRKKVQDHARRLKADPKLEVTLVGYTDDLVACPTTWPLPNNGSTPFTKSCAATGFVQTRFAAMWQGRSSCRRLVGRLNAAKKCAESSSFMPIKRRVN
jgi:hypothetical protein